MAQEEFGQRVWFFPDGDLPPAGDGSYKGHESLIILNPNDRDAEVALTVYFEDGCGNLWARTWGVGVGGASTRKLTCVGWFVERGGGVTFIITWSSVCSPISSSQTRYVITKKSVWCDLQTDSAKRKCISRVKGGEYE